MAEVAIAELVRLNSAETGPTEPPFSIEINSNQDMKKSLIQILPTAIGLLAGSMCLYFITLFV